MILDIGSCTAESSLSFIQTAVMKQMGHVVFIDAAPPQNVQCDGFFFSDANCLAVNLLFHYQSLIWQQQSAPIIF